MYNWFICFLSLSTSPGASRPESDHASPLSADDTGTAVPSVVALLQGDGGSEEQRAHVSVCGRERGRGERVSVGGREGRVGGRGGGMSV